MKEAFTKENIENWLVEFLTSHLIQKKGQNFLAGWFYVIAIESEQLHINQLEYNYTLLNLYSLTKKKDNMVRKWKCIDLDCMPERALALLAIIHRPAYEFYKKIVQEKEKSNANPARKK